VSDGRVELARARRAVAQGEPNRAIDLYDRVPRFSQAWPMAVFEASRERANLKLYGRALGQIMTLRAPQLADWVFPEAFAIEADIYSQNCYYKRALAIAAHFRAAVLPLRDRVMDLLGGAPLGKEVPWIATRLTGATTEAQRWDQLDHLLVEIDLAETTLDDIEARSREQMTALVDGDDKQWTWIVQVVDDQHHSWHFDGEYWPDELGYYNVPLRSSCVRKRGVRTTLF